MQKRSIPGAVRRVLMLDWVMAHWGICLFLAGATAALVFIVMFGYHDDDEYGTTDLAFATALFIWAVSAFILVLFGVSSGVAVLIGLGIAVTIFVVNRAVRNRHRKAIGLR